MYLLTVLEGAFPTAESHFYCEYRGQLQSERSGGIDQKLGTRVCMTSVFEQHHVMSGQELDIEIMNSMEALENPELYDR